MDKFYPLEKDDVVRLTKCEQKCFRDCFMVITDVRNWGAIGFIYVPNSLVEAHPRKAYYRACWDEMTFIARKSDDKDHHE